MHPQTLLYLLNFVVCLLVIFLSAVSPNITMIDDFGLKFVYFFHILHESKGGTVANYNKIIVVTDQSTLEIVLIEIRE